MTIEERIQSYLANGGTFNPDFMEHEGVRDLIMDCRDEIEALHNSNIRLVLAAERLLKANESLGMFSENNITYYEESPSKSAQCCLRWMELNNAITTLKRAVKLTKNTWERP